MTGTADENRLLALGKLQGLLAAFAWANHKCNHHCTFIVEELPAGTDIHQSLVQHFGDQASKVSVNPVDDWREVVGTTLTRWLFIFCELLDPKGESALPFEEVQRQMIDMFLESMAVGLQPTEVWSVAIEPKGFYELVWDDFAFRAPAGLYLLHLGMSD